MFFNKSLKSKKKKKKKLARTLFIMSVDEYGWAIKKSLLT